MNPHRNDDDDNLDREQDDNLDREQDDNLDREQDDNLDREQDDDRHDHAEADDLLTLGEVARLLRIPPATLRYWRHQHTGPRSFRIGRHVRYSRTDVEEWLRAQRGSGDPGAA